MKEAATSGSGHELLAYFRARLDSHSASYADYFTDPVNKNRLQAVGEVRSRLPSRLEPDFERSRSTLLGIVRKCSADFEPAFDSEYGTGRGVFRLLEEELRVAEQDVGIR